MSRLSRTPIVALLGAGAIALAGYAVYHLVEVGADYDEMAEEAYVGVDGEPVDERQAQRDARDRLASVARGASRIAEPSPRAADPLLAEGEVVPPPTVSVGAISPADAEVGFDYAMRRVESIAGARRKLKLDEWEALYREANDAFAAYSSHLDATDLEQAAALEDAYLRLKKGLKRVRVRGKKLAY